jgi:uncharacterized protein
MCGASGRAASGVRIAIELAAQRVTRARPQPSGWARTAALALALAAGSVFAQSPLQIGWDHLAPKLSASDNPFSKLTPEQLNALVDVAALRDRRERNVKLSVTEVASEKVAAQRLRKDGIDVEDLLSRRTELAAKQQALTKATNPELDGKLVRLPGYLLPLEINGRHVSEFLLVPWVGACIHTPPPPPNQIVHVKADKPYETTGAFEAVWITGRMSAGAAKQSLHLVDGAADVDVGYSLRASRVEKYKE